MIAISIKNNIFECNSDNYGSKETDYIALKFKLLSQMGENFKLARKRIKLTTSQIAERADILHSTLYLIEKGDPRCSDWKLF